MLLLHVGPCRATHPDRPHHVNVHHAANVSIAEFIEWCQQRHARVIYEDMHTSEGVQSRLNNGLSPIPCGDAVAVSHSHSTGSPDLLDYGRGTRGNFATAVRSGPKIVHDDFRTPACQEQGVSTTEAWFLAAATGDNGHHSIESKLFHVLLQSDCSVIY